SKNLKINNAPIKILQSDDLDDLPMSQVIIATKEKNIGLEKLYSSIEGRSTLVFSDSYVNPRLVMINFVTKGSQLLNFEYNKANIILHGLKPGPNLTLFKGTEIDVAELYRKGQASLVVFQQKLRRQQSKIEKQNLLVQKQQQDLMLQQKQFTEVKKEIDKSQILLEQGRKDNLASQNKISELNTVLSGQQTKISSQEKRLIDQNSTLGSQKILLGKHQTQLSAQTKELVFQAKELFAKKTLLEKQESLLLLQKSEQQKLKAQISFKSRTILQQEKSIKTHATDIIKQKAEIKHHKQRVIDIRDSIKDNVQVLADQKKEIEEQNKTLTAQGLTINQQSSTLNFLWGIVFLISVLIFTLFKAYNDKKKCNADLKEAREIALQASNSKSTFLANMSHEIRTPMNAILGFTELLKGRLTDKKNNSFLHSIDVSGRSLLRLINDILDLSKVEAGKIELEYSAINPQALFMELKTIFSQKISQKGIDFIIDISEDLPQALILDETRLRQILFNLIGNAIKFTDEGYVKVSVKHYAEEDGSQVTLCIDVEDSGIGVPEENRQKIFNTFEQQSGQSHAKYGGTGLGLAISKKLTELMKGEIDLQQAAQGGALFKIKLREVQIAVTADERYFSENVTDIIAFSEAKVLIVDDIDLNRELIEHFLNDSGIITMQAANGLECLDLARNNRPDLILMDMKMPGMDGFEASSLIKKNPMSKDIPITAVTASAFKEDETRILFVADSYMAKPISKPKLIQELMNFLSWKKDLDLKKPVVRDNPFQGGASNGTGH
ncbi:MAG: response regulator, partial [Lentisphaeraceae bacterium]|nr:response regulator [Lentisphaeraceae bacterium]